MTFSCPSCRPRHPLQTAQSPENLVAHRCYKCEGTFLPAANFLQWKEALRDQPPEQPETSAELIVEDTADALICPQCSRIMLKYAVGHGITFRIDFCRSCNGIWLDRNEWEVLKSRQLHQTLNFVCTDGWQRKVRQQEFDRRMQELFRRRVGEQTFARVEAFRTWLATNPFRAEILAHLQDEAKDP